MCAMSDTAAVPEIDSGSAKRHRKHEREHPWKQQPIRPNRPGLRTSHEEGHPLPVRRRLRILEGRLTHDGDYYYAAGHLRAADMECRRLDGAVRGNVNRLGVHAS